MAQHDIVDYTNLLNETFEKKEIIGDLSNLTTTAKNNLVAAINEAAASGGGGGIETPVSIANGGTGNSAGYIRTGQKSGTTIGNYATAEGYDTTASGNYSHAEGSQTSARGNYSHTEGSNVVATKSCSHAEGTNTTSSGDYSHAEGNNTYASGNCAHSEGYLSSATGNYSHAGGWYTNANQVAQTAIGKFNDNKTNTLFEIGNGTADDARSNAFEVFADGQINANGAYNYNGSPLFKKVVKTTSTIDTSNTIYSTETFIFQGNESIYTPLSITSVEGATSGSGGIRITSFHTYHDTTSPNYARIRVGFSSRDGVSVIGGESIIIISMILVNKNLVDGWNVNYT